VPEPTSLSGTGLILGVSPSALDFGNQTVGTSSGWRSLVLRNVSSTTTVTIVSVVLSGNAGGDYAMRSLCGSSLGPDSTCPIEVQFTPTKNGARKASVTVLHSSAGGSLIAPLTGIGK
jgi:hypothetical protein